MDKTIKYLGGIGYILLLVGPILSAGSNVAGGLSLIGVILAAVAWILLGRNLNDRVMMANGIMMIVGPITIAVAMFGVLMAAVPTTNQPAMPKDSAPIIQALLSVAAMVVIIAIVCWILQVLSHFRAGGKLGISPFKYSAYCQIIVFVLVILAIIWLFGNISAIIPQLQAQATKPDPKLFFKIFGPVFGLIALGGLLGIISNVLSAVAFFSIKE